MIKVIAGVNVIEGSLSSYERDGEDLLLRLMLRRPNYIEVRLPKINLELISFINKLGLEKMKNCVIDLNKGNIKVDEVMKSSGKSVQKAKFQEGTNQGARRIGTGSIIG